ncbi:MAG TPA: LysM peptidoglycan-binding domain-containing protein [Terriglobales bacterium]|nr:LysM peptidoglycan-binding domain-containing protein [Terriglobales bacterium]
MKDATAPAATPDAATPPQETGAAEPVPPTAGATDIKLQDNPPSRYTVKRGDTLWGISGRFLKNPWKWPEIWGMNKDEIKNPHLIYPGEVIVLDLSGATPRLRLEGVSDGGLSRWSGYELQVSKLEPRVRSTALSAAIPTISAKDLAPFLSRSLVVDPETVALAPKIVAGADTRVVLSANDTAFAVGVQQSKGSFWNVFRPGRIFIDPDTKEMLGREAVYLGDAQVESFGEVAALRILQARQEISTGDRLAVMSELPTLPYVPRAPERKVHGKVIAGSSDALSEFGPLSMVVLNRGARDGLEPGQVLSLYRNQGTVTAGDVSGRVLRLPLQEYGLVMVYRVFNKVSFALVMSASRSVHVNDIVHNPS